MVWGAEKRGLSTENIMNVIPIKTHTKFSIQNNCILSHFNALTSFFYFAPNYGLFETIAALVTVAPRLMHMKFEPPIFTSP
jgi:hypothetical protein